MKDTPVFTFKGKDQHLIHACKTISVLLYKRLQTTMSGFWDPSGLDRVI